MSMKLERTEVNDFEKQNLGVKEIYMRLVFAKWYHKIHATLYIVRSIIFIEIRKLKKKGVGNVILKIT